MNPFFCLLLVSFLVKASHFDEKQYMTDAIKLACLQNFNVIEQNIYDAISKSKGAKRMMSCLKVFLKICQKSTYSSSQLLG